MPDIIKVRAHVPVLGLNRGEVATFERTDLLEAALEAGKVIEVEDGDGPRLRSRRKPTAKRRGSSDTPDSGEDTTEGEAPAEAPVSPSKASDADGDD